jgi:hypothetical protein
MLKRSPAWRRPISAVIRQMAGVLLALLLQVLQLVGGGPLAAAWAAPDLAPINYRCDGDPLQARLVAGAMDDPTIPDPSNAPVPVGASVLLQWRDQQLQLPRTNNAGAASFSDGRWWWSLEDPDHPRFRLRRRPGLIDDYACEAMP